MLNISMTPTSVFVGRNEKLAEIHMEFERLAASTDQRRIIVLYGLGGVGKTELALSYIFSNRQKYKAIMGIESRDEESIFRSFRNIAQRLLEWGGNSRLRTPALNYTRVAFELGLDRFASTESGGIIRHDSDGRGVSDAVVRWLEKEGNTDWLLVFDAADDLESFDLTSYFPKYPNGEILITSRRRQASLLGSGISVDCLKPADGEQVVIRHGHITESGRYSGETLFK